MTADEREIGSTELARLYGKSRKWALAQLRAWWFEQEAGGPVRVFRKGRRATLYTTLAALRRHVRPARDGELVRKVEALDRELDRIALRLSREEIALADLERRALGHSKSTRALQQRLRS